MREGDRSGPLEQAYEFNGRDHGDATVVCRVEIFVSGHEVLRWGDRGHQSEERAILFVADRRINGTGVDELCLTRTAAKKFVGFTPARAKAGWSFGR